MHASTKFSLAAIAAVSIAAAATSVGSADSAPAHMTVLMHALNGSGQDGTATITQSGDSVIVAVHLTGEPHDASEPAHVHFGRCPNIKAIPAYNVGPIVDGTATAVVDLSWAEITSGKYVINVHQSTEALGRYMSCGDIAPAASPAPVPTEDSGY